MTLGFWHVHCFTIQAGSGYGFFMVEFIRDVVVVLALLMSLFALADRAPVEPERRPLPSGPLSHGGPITVPAAPAVNAAK